MADYDDVVGDFIMEMKPGAFAKYCQRRAISFPTMEPNEGDGCDEDVDDRNHPLKFFLLAKLLHVDVDCVSEMKAFLSICRKAAYDTVFADYREFPSDL